MRPVNAVPAGDASGITHMIYRLSGFASAWQSSSIRRIGTLQTGAMRISSAALYNDDATAVTLKNKSRAGDNADNVQGADEKQRPKVAGAAQQLFAQLAKLGGNLQHINQALSETAEGTSQREDLLKEQAAILSEYDRITQSSTFKQLSELTQRVNEQLQAGASGGMLSRALESQRGLLGDGYLGLVQNGDAYRLAQISDSVSEIGNITGESLTVSAEAASRVGTLAQQALDALSGGSYQEEKTKEAVPLVENGTRSLPTPTVMNFDLPGKLSIQMVTYTGADLMKAVKSDLLPDPRMLVHLITDPPEDKDDEKKNKDYY